MTWTDRINNTLGSLESGSWTQECCSKASGRKSPTSRVSMDEVLVAVLGW